MGVVTIFNPLTTNIAMSIKILVSQGPEKHSVVLDEPDYTTVEDLKGLLQEKTGIPPESQKLIFSGKTLKDDQLVSEVGIKDNSKLMLLGRKTDPRQDEWIKKLDNIDASTSSIGNKITKLEQEVEELYKGFLPEELEKQHREKLSKQCLGHNESLMKNLEELDAVIPPANETLVRGKRRTLVTKIQSLMTQTDTIHNKLLSSSKT